ncbi:MAG: polyphosphate kinase 2 family protein [Chitinophagaceae bacterium]
MGKKNPKQLDDQLRKLSKKDLTKKAESFSRPYCVSNGKKFKLKNYSTSEDGDLGPEDQPLVKEVMQMGVEVLAGLQDVLYAQDKWAVLLIFQAMDAAGKDGAIKHVMSGVNPQGCQVTSFKVPSEEELDHDFLWRCNKHLPERGRIGIFNRSYYEEVLVVRVHEQILQNQKLPPELITKHIWDERLEDIRHYEQYLNRNGVAICKFFLHVSKDEQKKRFLERIDEKDKNWKFSAGDVKERAYWKQYMNAYEEMIKATATPTAPWYVVPADHKSFARIVVSSAIIHTLNSLNLSYPTLTKEQETALVASKKLLLSEKG